MPTTKHTMLGADSDSIEYINKNQVKSQWVESISLPMYSSRAHSNKHTLLMDNYAYIKHMMSGLELRQNIDFIIVPNEVGGKVGVQVKFRQGCEQYASMCVLLWERYKTAKIESAL